MPSISPERFRNLSLEDLGLDYLANPPQEFGPIHVPALDKSELDESDPILAAARAAFDMGYAGIILCGSPGTGKSWYAQQIAVALSGNWEYVRSVQFHPSYQYEDFVFGYAPSMDGGFELRPKEFARTCKDAAKLPGATFVLVIDEISRSDVVRVFGEALTYIEMDKREQPFQAASGEELTIPRNLLVIATMNPWDKGVDELDMALERRFAQIDLRPSVDVLRRLLSAKGASPAFIDRLSSFFEQLQGLSPETVRLGHAYFLGCTDETSATKVWEFRLRPTLRRACRLESTLYDQIEGMWNEVVESKPQTTGRVD